MVGSKLKFEEFIAKSFLTVQELGTQMIKELVPLMIELKLLELGTVQTRKRPVVCIQG